MKETRIRHPPVAATMPQPKHPRLARADEMPVPGCSARGRTFSNDFSPRLLLAVSDTTKAQGRNCAVAPCADRDDEHRAFISALGGPVFSTLRGEIGDIVISVTRN